MYMYMYLYMYICICICIYSYKHIFLTPATVWSPLKPSICKLFATFWKQPPIWTFFATFASHNLGTGPCLAVHVKHINLNLAESSTYFPKPAYVLPIAYLTHASPLIVVLLSLYIYIYVYSIF